MRLTQRGRRVAAAAAALLLLVLLLLVVKSCGSGSGQQQAVPAPASPTASGSSSPHPSASPSSTASGAGSTSATPGASATATTSAGGAGEGTDTTGMVHTGLLGTGTWTTSTLAIAPAEKTARVHRFVVKAEGGTKVDANEAARQVMSVLNDKRGWLGYQGQSFELVSDPKQADFTIFLASPGRVEKMCPLDVKMTWSCSAGPKVILNTDRWYYMTPTYHDLTDYRAYMVNHEVGHYIGFGHRPCPGPGQPAPVMLQQSKTLGGCVANPWPTSAEKS